MPEILDLLELILKKIFFFYSIGVFVSPTDRAALDICFPRIVLRSSNDLPLLRNFYASKENYCHKKAVC